MKLYGSFNNIKGEDIYVYIYNINNTSADVNINNVDWVCFADDPVEITTECEDSFTHIIKKSCKIRLSAKQWMGDILYANNYESVVVNVYRENECIFAGYVTPNTFNMDYVGVWNNIEINCTDPLTTLSDKYLSDGKLDKYSELKQNSKIRTFKELIQLLNIANTTYDIGNLPDFGHDATMWVETGYERVVDAQGNVNYYIVSTNTRVLDSNSAVKIDEQQTSTTSAAVTYVQSTDTETGPDGLLYYKKYAYITVNGEHINTGDYILGDPAPMPYIIGNVNRLDGWTYGALPQPFEYYEHFTIDHEMSDGAMKPTQNDTIGEQIPLTPSTTTLGSFYEFRQGSEDDPDIEENQGQVTYYYKMYAWIIMDFDNISHQYKTGDWYRGEPFIPAEQGQLGQ